MVVPASPIVPRNEYGGVFPVAGTAVAIRVISNRIHDGRYPRRSLAAVDGMVRILPGGRDPADLRERAVTDVVQDVGRRSVDVTVRFTLNPVRPGANSGQRDADVRKRVRRYPEAALAFGIVSPGHLRAGLAEQIIHRVPGEALRRFVARSFRSKRRSTVSVRPDQLHRASRATTIQCARTVLGGEDAERVVACGGRGRSAENILMRGKTRALVGLKHPVRDR